MTREQQGLATLVAAVASAWPAANFSEGTVALWMESLSDLPVERVGIAVRKLIATSRFCPSIAEVRFACLEQTPTIGEHSASEAWGIVLDAVARYGWARSPVFADPVVERALQCTIGWYDLCTSDVADGASHRARFVTAYESLQRRVREDLLLPHKLREQIAAARKDFVAGTLDGEDGRPSISEQRRRALDLIKGLGDGPPRNPAGPPPAQPGANP